MRLEDMMAGLFGDVEAGGARGFGDRVGAADDERDPRRRRAGLDSGFGGIAGGEVTLASILPHLQGLRAYDYSGPNIRGLADLLPGMGKFQDITGPARGHLNRQGGNFALPPGLADMPDLPPGIDTRNAIGGPNVAPGNVDTGFALGQAPGIPAHARGQAEGQYPQTQAWRNVAPGYSAAAQLGYGTPEFESRMRGQGFGGRPSAVAGGVSEVAPGAGGGQAAGGGGVAAKGTGGGPTPVKAGGPAEVAPAAGGRTVGAPAGGSGGGKPGAPPGAINPTGRKAVKSSGPTTGAAGKPRTTKVSTSGKTGITKTVSTGGGEGKYVNVTAGKGTTEKQMLKQIAKISKRPGPKTDTSNEGRGQPVPAPAPAQKPGKTVTDTSNQGAGQPIPTATVAKKGSTKPKNTTNGVPNWKLG